MSKPPLIVELEFTTLRLYENYIISQPKEGVVIKELQMEEVVKTCLDFYQKKKVGYISYRINNFNVNPLIYLKLNRITNLIAVAVVTEKPSSLNTAAFESHFIKLPFKIFLDLRKAEEWVRVILQKEGHDEEFTAE